MGNFFSGGNSTTSYTPNPAVTSAFTNILNAGQNVVANTGAPNYTPETAQQYSGYVPGLVAPQTPDQIAAIQNIAGLQGYTQPYFQQATQAAQGAAQPVQLQQFSPDAVNQYLSPYLNDVVGSAVANINQTNAQQQQQVLGNSIQRGAFGGDRAGIAQAELARQQGLAGNATIANLLNTGYGQALGEFNQQQQQNLASQLQGGALNLQAAQTLGNLGLAGQQGALQQAQAQYGAGATQQQQQQAGLSTAYQQYLNQYQSPYNQLSWLTGLASGAGTGLGGTTTGTPASPSLATSLTSGLGILSSLGIFNQGGRVKNYEKGGVVGYDSGGTVPTDTLTPAYDAYQALAKSGNASLADLHNAYAAYVNATQPKVGAALPTSASGAASGLAQYFGGANSGSTSGTTTPQAVSAGLAAIATGGGGGGNQGGVTARNANYSPDFTRSNGPVGGGGYGPYDNGGGGGASFNFGGPLGGLVAGIGSIFTGGGGQNTTPRDPAADTVAPSVMGPDPAAGMSDTKDEGSKRGGRIHKAGGGLIPYTYGLQTKDDIKNYNADIFGSGSSADTPTEEASASSDVLGGMKRGGVIGHYAPGGNVSDDASDDSSGAIPAATYQGMSGVLPGANTSFSLSDAESHARNAGIPVKDYVNLIKGESGGKNVIGDNGSSAGVLQLHVGNASQQYPNPGKGDDYINEMHPELADKLTPQQKVAFINDPANQKEESQWAANFIAKNGANAWTVARQQGILGARDADMPAANAKNASAQIGDQGTQKKGFLLNLLPGLDDPQRLALLKASAAMAGTPGPFGYALAKAASTYADQLVESKKLESQTGLQGAQAEQARSAGLKDRAQMGRAGILTFGEEGLPDVTAKNIPIGGGAGTTAPSTGSGGFNVPPASQAAAPSPTGGQPTGGGTQPTGAPQAPKAPVGPNQAQPLQNFPFASIRDDSTSADQKAAAIEAEINKLNSNPATQYGPYSQQLAGQYDKLNESAATEATAANAGKKDLLTLVKSVSNQPHEGLLASGAQKQFRDSVGNYIQTAGKVFGLNAGFEPGLSADEQARKIAAWNSVQQGRHAGFITQGLEQAFPTGALQPETQRQLVANMIVQNQQAQDYRNFMDYYGQRTNGTGGNGDVVFRKIASPEEYSRDATAIAALLKLSDSSPRVNGQVSNPITDLMSGKGTPQQFDQYVHDLYVKTKDPRFAVHNLSRYIVGIQQ